MVRVLEFNLLMKDDHPIPRITTIASPPVSESQGWDDFPVVMESLQEECTKSVKVPSSTTTYKLSTVLPKRPMVKGETITIVPSTPVAFRDSFDWSTFPLILDD
mmetsp:Transcript_17357/g.32931  ORF Transcript_17357/g.32931 Transcript_17357/m.32931 type:complete len:104 (-) Transcript_17357:111-422(-)|eukprot:scaffold6351_cov166-Amphora_coffeaeformis.AAC.7